MRIRRRTNKEESHQWDRLATYNAERARGLVHTAEYDDLMQKDQEIFDRLHGGPFPRVDPVFLPDYRGTPS